MNSTNTIQTRMVSMTRLLLQPKRAHVHTNAYSSHTRDVASILYARYCDCTGSTHFRADATLVSSGRWRPFRPVGIGGGMATLRSLSSSPSSLPPSPPKEEEEKVEMDNDATNNNEPSNESKNQEGTNETETETETETMPTNATATPPFPWRASAKTPLPRIGEMDDLSGLHNSARARFLRKALTALEMDVSWWQILVTKGWERELAENCGWAFQMAMCALLSRTFQVPIWNIENDENGYLKLDTTNSTETGSMTEEEKEVTTDYLNSMLEENLRSLYDTYIDEENLSKRFKVKFQLRPIQCQLESAFIIPHLTRDDVKKIPSLKGAYTAIENEWNKSKSMEVIKEMGEELSRKTSQNGSRRSLIIDVSIHCLEVFQVLDAVSGNVLQGTENGLEEEVTHLVRFEMVTTKGEKRTERILGSWQIIDIDDMLDGNVWH